MCALEQRALCSHASQSFRTCCRIYLFHKPTHQGKDKMSKIRKRRALLGASFLFALIAAIPASAQVSNAATQTANPNRIRILPPPPPVSPGPPPDSNLFTTYSFYSTYTNVNWIVCGSTQETEGCYDAGSLGPFGHAGALIEGNESVSGNTVKRNIFVVDDADGGGTGVKLYVYTKTDVITPTFDTTTVSLTNTVTLPLTGGAHVTTYMAADDGFLFIGTNQSQSAVRVQKSDLAVGQIGGFSPPINVSSITSNKYGYVAVTFGGISGSDGSYEFDPFGNLTEGGGGADFVLSNSNGFSTANLVPTTSSANLAARMKVKFKKAAAPQNTTEN
jgi:hypothetical protein